MKKLILAFAIFMGFMVWFYFFSVRTINRVEEVLPKVVEKRVEEVDVVVIEAYFRPPLLPFNSGARLVVSYDNEFYTFYDKNTYYAFKNKVNETVTGIATIHVYDDGTEFKQITGLVREPQ